MKVCAFTGHRFLTDDFDRELLKRVTENLAKNGVKKFLCGMAVGFDMESAKAVLEIKKKYGLALVACLPCAEQSANFSEKNKKLYNEILSRCDETVVLEPCYVAGCMYKRDRYLVENSDVLVCFLRRNSGGTYYTVNYARKMNKKIIEL